jgi:uncharacterized membrane protein YeaQ/YmgE (transglycosylase-associated protein family)
LAVHVRERTDRYVHFVKTALNAQALRVSAVTEMEAVMTLLTWIALGLFSVVLARTFLYRRVTVRLADSALVGTVGALIGGSLFSLFGTGLTYGIVGATAGAVVALSAWQLLGHRVETVPTVAGD